MTALEQSSGSAETKQRELSRIIAAFDRDQPDGLLHVVIDHVDNSLSNRVQRLPLTGPWHTTRTGGYPLNRKGHCPAEEKSRGQASEKNIGVGYCETLAALAVAHRARFCACA